MGLYSGIGTFLLETDIDSSITTYVLFSNQSNVTDVGNDDDSNYNIAIRVHLGKYSGNIIIEI